MRSWATVSGSYSGSRPAACAASRRRANSRSSAISASYALCSRLVVMVSSSGGWAGGWSRLPSGRFGRPQWGRPDRSAQEVQRGGLGVVQVAELDGDVLGGVVADCLHQLVEQVLDVGAAADQVADLVVDLLGPLGHFPVSLPRLCINCSTANGECQGDQPRFSRATVPAWKNDDPAAHPTPTAPTPHRPPQCASRA